RVRNFPRSSTSSLDEKITQLSKIYKIVLLREKVGSLKVALDTAIRRKSRKRRYVRTEEALTISKVGSSCGDDKSALKRVRGERRYGRYKQTRHNARTCAVEVDSASNRSDSND
ncbi:hypothetical protein COCHEDRAFT_1096652, partial [Bipolaris maydis C5]